MISPGNAVLWHPFVKEHIAENWNGVGSKDKVTYNNGAKFEREVIDWNILGHNDIYVAALIQHCV